MFYSNGMRNAAVKATVLFYDKVEVRQIGVRYYSTNLPMSAMSLEI